MKVYKKRWFTLVTGAGIPENIAQGMLGRRSYLDEYVRLTLEMKQELARKILKIVSIHSEKIEKQEVLTKASEVLGVVVDEKSIQALKTILANYHKLPAPDKARLLGGEAS